MTYKKLLLLLTGIISLFLYSCSQDPVSVGLGLLKGDYLNVKEKDSYSDSLTQSSSYSKYTVPLTSSTSTLLIGKALNVTGSTLSQFYISMEDSIKKDILSGSAYVTSSEVTMYPNYVFGDSMQAMDFSVYKISNPWSAAGVDADSIAYLGISGTDLSSNRSITDTLITYNIDKSYALNLLRFAADSSLGTDHGIYIKPTSSSKKIIGIYNVSTSSSSYNTLRIVITKPGSYTDTLSFAPWKEAGIVSGTMPVVSSDEIAVQSGLVVNSRITFDVSSIPKNSLINYAGLTLTLDTVATKVGSNYADYLKVLLLTDSTNRAYDSTQSITLTRTNGTFTGNIATYVQYWIDSQINQGILIQVYNQIDGVELYAIKGSNAANRALRPRLQITYTGRK